jgi:hypothetical protein
MNHALEWPSIPSGFRLLTIRQGAPEQGGELIPSGASMLAPRQSVSKKQTHAHTIFAYTPRPLTWRNKQPQACTLHHLCHSASLSASIGFIHKLPRPPFPGRQGPSSFAHHDTAPAPPRHGHGERPSGFPSDRKEQQARTGHPSAFRSPATARRGPGPLLFRLHPITAPGNANNPKLLSTGPSCPARLALRSDGPGRLVHR